MNTNKFEELWRKLAKSKKYREEFVVAQVKRGIPFQIRSLLKGRGWKQEELAERAGLTQGVISRAMNPNYGNLTLNTLIRIAAGFDVAFIGHFVPFSELGKWFLNLSEAENILSFEEENRIAETAGLAVLQGSYAKHLSTTTQLVLPKKGPEPQKVIPFKLAEGADWRPISDLQWIRNKGICQAENRTQKTSEPQPAWEAQELAAVGMGR